MPAERGGSSEAGITGSCETPDMVKKEQNSCPLQEQHLHLTAEPSFHPHSVDLMSYSLTARTFSSSYLQQSNPDS